MMMQFLLDTVGLVYKVSALGWQQGPKVIQGFGSFTFDQTFC